MKSGYKVKARMCWNCGVVKLGTAARRYCSDTCRKDAWRKREDIYGRAHYLVNQAVKTGRLIPAERCEHCGEAYGRMQAHHDDYSKPLDVRWLCVICHKRTHDGTLELALDAVALLLEHNRLNAARQARWRERQKAKATS